MTVRSGSPIMLHIAAHLQTQAPARESFLLIAVSPFCNTSSQPKHDPCGIQLPYLDLNLIQQEMP